MDFFSFFGRKQNNDVSTVFTSEKTAISAEHAYQKSRFGCLKTDKQLLEEFFVDVRHLIEQKNMAGKFSGIMEICDDIVQFIPQIVKKLTEELGYKVIVLDDETEIINKHTKEKTTMKTGTTFIVLIWNKEAVRDVSAMNYTINVNTENLEKRE